MSKRGSYIGGHTVLTQQPRDFESALERKAVSAEKRAKRAQADFDKARAEKLAKKQAIFEELNRSVERSAARRVMTGKQRADKILRAPKVGVVVVKMSRKSTRSPASTRRRTERD